LPNESSISVEVIFLDNAAVVDTLRSAARELVEGDENVVRVCLFGSLADGTATPESDADILIVVREAEGRFFDRGDEYKTYLSSTGLGIGIELFVYTETELERMNSAGNPFIKEILATAEVLGER
jgi:predicted nucleotidyltransferase